MKVAFTGHRPNKLQGGYDTESTGRWNLRRTICETLMELRKTCDIEEVITGGALGVDQDAARAAWNLSIPYAVYVPCMNHSSKWPTDSQLYYQRIISGASRIHKAEVPYSAQAMQDRNVAMVNDCDILIAVFDGTAGGTANCVKYATRKGKRIVRIDPRTFAVDL